MSEREPDGVMSPTTETLRDRDFRTLECDIPAELTIRQYRQTRAGTAAEPPRAARVSRLPRLLRRRGRQPDAAA